ncbi:MAG: DeoR/GlpR family DNA-binding transcription regulator [Nocardioidaceae bacterium]
MRADRLAAILDRIAQESSVDVTRLARKLDVSGATIRRDLQTLHEQGLLVRTHGGAVAGNVGLELPIRYKEARQQSEKRRIGAAAARLVTDGAVAGLSGGTTATEVARALARRRDITVVTNAVNIAAELVLRPNIKLVVVGGNARHASYELVGPSAEEMLGKYHLDVAFIGVDGLTVDEGCTTHDEMEAHTDHAFIRRCRRTIVVSDSTKIGRVTFARICGIGEVTDVVTDAGPDGVELERLREAGVNVIQA